MRLQLIVTWWYWGEHFLTKVIFHSKKKKKSVCGFYLPLWSYKVSVVPTVVVVVAVYLLFCLFVCFCFAYLCVSQSVCHSLGILLQSVWRFQLPCFVRLCLSFETECLLSSVIFLTFCNGLSYKVSAVYLSSTFLYSMSARSTKASTISNALGFLSFFFSTKVVLYALGFFTASTIPTWNCFAFFFFFLIALLFLCACYLHACVYVRARVCVCVCVTVGRSSYKYPPSLSLSYFSSFHVPS